MFKSLCWDVCKMLPLCTCVAFLTRLPLLRRVSSMHAKTDAGASSIQRQRLCRCSPTPW